MDTRTSYHGERSIWLGVVTVILVLMTAGCGTLASTPPSTPTSLPTPTSSPTPNPAVADSLTAVSHDWPVSPPTCQYISGGYEVTSGSAGGLCLSRIIADDGTIVVTVAITNDSGTFAGIVIRGNGIVRGCYTCYVFGIDSRGDWAFAEVVNGQNATVITENSNSAIQSGIGQMNTLQVQFQGSHFEFTVNGTMVGQADDGTITGLGGIGFVSATGMQATFTDFALYP